MISIGEYRNLKQIEEEWCKLLKQYLFQNAKVYIEKGRKKKREYFSTRYDKAVGMIDYAYSRKKITVGERNNLKNVLNEYRNDLSERYRGYRRN